MGKLGSLSDLVGIPAVVATVLVGIVILLVAATSGGQFGRVVAGLIAVLVVIVGLFLMLATWIKRMNADIGSNRADLKRDMDEILEERDTEE